MKIKKVKDLTQAEIQRGEGLLKSLQIVANVLFALLVFQAFLILPRPGDPELEYNTLSQIFNDHLMSLLVIVVGLILIIVYWIQFNMLLGNIKHSTPLHAVLALTQVIFLMIYLYFLRFDMEYDGMTLALQMESIFLALAGFVGALNWRYARYAGLTTEQITEEEERTIFYKVLPEPLASLFTLPFAGFGAGIWTLAFLAIFPIGWALKFIQKKRNN
jgi:hypothetical protein